MMNYDQKLTDLIAEIKTDKSILQPWRNKAAARAEEVQAFIRMGRSITPPGVLPAGMTLANPIGIQDTCICFAGTMDKTCPVHGLMI